MYLDSAEEQISMFQEVNEPPKYVVFTPSLFFQWSEWAKNYKPPQDGRIRPFGEKVGPQWMRWNFKGLEDFYQYYKEIIEETNG